MKLISILALALLLSGAASADGGQSPRPLVSKRWDRLFSGWRPLKPHRAYLIVTATGGSTDILAVAPNNVSPTVLAGALASALAATPWRGQPVEWSDDDWTAAHVRLSSARFGAGEAINTVPFGTLADGMRRAGIHPVPVLRVPDTALCARLSEPFYDDERFSWYDVGPLKSGEVFRVRENVSPVDVFTLLLPFLVLPLLGWGGLWLASRRALGPAPTLQERKKYELAYSLPVMVALIGWMFWLVFNGGMPPALLAVGDVWFGAPSEGMGTPFMVFFVALISCAYIVALVAKSQSMRVLGPDGVVSASAMSPEERTLRTRGELWGDALPMLALLVMLFLLIARPGLLPPFVAKFVAPLTLLLVTVPLGIYFHRRTRAFTKETPDSALTEQIRTVSVRPGFAAPEVIIEHSARASEFAFLETRPKGRVLVSQKLAETATPDEMTFLLAHQSALNRTSDTSSILLFLVVLVMLAVLIGPRWLMSHVHVGYILMLGLVFGFLILVLWLLLGVMPRQELARLQNADQSALAETGDRKAAASALDLLLRYGAPYKGPGNSHGLLKTQIAKRLAALGANPHESSKIGLQ
ncbi:MAG: M48 family metalloprotease [Armatimonadota bacterium]|nr:M48 family metalloprotease [Armatimonadota bacterium]